MKANRIKIQERFTYYITESEQDLGNILQNGFYCSDSEMNILGKHVCFILFKIIGLVAVYFFK